MQAPEAAVTSLILTKINPVKRYLIQRIDQDISEAEGTETVALEEKPYSILLFCPHSLGGR